VPVSGWTPPANCASFFSNPVDEIAEVFLDEVPGMVEAFGNNAKQSHLRPFMTEHGISPPQSGKIHFQTRRNRYGR